MTTLRPIPILIGVCALICTVGAAPAAAQPRGACRADIEKFCKDVKPGGSRIRDCLKSHEAELSAECRSHIQAGPGAVKQRRRPGGRPGRGLPDACREDLDKFCKDIRPGQGRIAACLKSHESELSEACKAALSRRPRAGTSGATKK